MKEQILQLRKQGQTYKNISLKLGISISTVSYHCCEFRESEKKDLFDRSKVALYQAYYDKCGNLAETATHFNLHLSSLKRNIVRPRKSKKIRKNYYRDVKQKALDYKGGKCETCGYNKSYWALDFHHKDPSQKDFTIAGGNKSFETLKPELDKCSLLCKNCHAEEHERLYNLKT